jgi:rhodanese-related sulfurtransferase
MFAAMDGGEDIYIMDIRRPEDYAEGHVKGAVNMNFFDMTIPENISKIPDDKPVLIYCYTGQSSSQAAAVLSMAGKQAKNVQSGYNGGILTTGNHEDYTDNAALDIGGPDYPTDPLAEAGVTAYFADKLRKDGTVYENNDIAPETVKEIVDNKDDRYLLLSVRRPEDFDNGHIPGAVNIPFGEGIQKELAGLPRDKIIIVYCYTGQTSSQTVAVLRAMGFEAYSMTGGMGDKQGGEGWLGAGYEVVKN